MIHYTRLFPHRSQSFGPPLNPPRGGAPLAAERARGLASRVDASPLASVNVGQAAPKVRCAGRPALDPAWPIGVDCEPTENNTGYLAPSAVAIHRTMTFIKSLR